MSQELVVSDDKKVLALCDLSDENSVLEIKTMDVLTEDGYLLPRIARQLYFEAKNRKTFVLSIVFDTHFIGNTFTTVVDAVNVYIYKVEIIEEELPELITEHVYGADVVAAFNLINDNPNISKSEISRILGCSLRVANGLVNRLINTGVIESVGSKNRSSWIVKKKIKEHS